MRKLQRFTGMGGDQFPRLEIGEVALGSVINGIENGSARGKLRPVVLVSSAGSLWRAAGLTTLSAYRDGSPRVAIPNPSRVGLGGPGFLWGANLTDICALDIHKHLGWVDAELAHRIIDLAALDGAVAEALLDSASRHHSPGREGLR